MFTMTITLKGTDHPIVLNFNTVATVQAASAEMDVDDSETVCIKDDWGRIALFLHSAIISHVTEDVAKYWEGRNKTSMIKLRAQHAFEMELKGDPTLSFLAGHQHPKFGDQS